MIFFGWPAHPPTKASGRILLLHCNRPPEIVIQSFRKRFEDLDFCDESFSVERGKDLKICWVCTVSSLAIITSETPTAACIWKDGKGMKTETEIWPEQRRRFLFYIFGKCSNWKESPAFQSNALKVDLSLDLRSEKVLNQAKMYWEVSRADRVVRFVFYKHHKQP